MFASIHTSSLFSQNLSENLGSNKGGNTSGSKGTSGKCLSGNFQKSIVRDNINGTSGSSQRSKSNNGQDGRRNLDGSGEERKGKGGLGELLKEVRAGLGGTTSGLHDDEDDAGKEMEITFVPTKQGQGKKDGKKKKARGAGADEEEDDEDGDGGLGPSVFELEEEKRRKKRSSETESMCPTSMSPWKWTNRKR